MASPEQIAQLVKLFAAAKAANAPWPAAQACEGVDETNWGTSKSYLEGNNVFGCKQHVHPVYGTVNLPTREFLDGRWVQQDDAFIAYPTVAASMQDRLATLKRLAPSYPHYAAALASNTPESFLVNVSKSWSTDPLRAQNCIAILHAHADVLR